MPRPSEKRSLYFICPTDYIEPIINDAFKHKNYYFSSLCNSIVFDNNVVGQIKYLIKEKRIEEISFVLSSDNCIISDTLEDQNFADPKKRFCNQINSQDKYLKWSWEIYNQPNLIISNHLNKKIEELKLGLKGVIHKLKIGGKIYYPNKNVFKDISPEDYFSLN